jgi:hypothetical protein
MDAEGFGACTNHRRVRGRLPQGIKIENIARMNRDYSLIWVVAASSRFLGSRISLHTRWLGARLERRRASRRRRRAMMARGVRRLGVLGVHRVAEHHDVRVVLRVQLIHQGAARELAHEVPELDGPELAADLGDLRRPLLLGEAVDEGDGGALGHVVVELLEDGKILGFQPRIKRCSTGFLALDSMAGNCAGLSGPT